MSDRTKITRVALVAGLAIFPFSLATATTNSISPGIAETPYSSEAPRVEPQPTDPERFFAAYARAARLVDQHARQEASIVMDLLCRNLHDSPWLEIAMLKHAELSEFSNPAVALQDYDVLRKRVENAPYFQSTTNGAAVFRASLLGSVMRGVDRIHRERVREALERYRFHYRQYPESLLRLSIFNYVDLQDLYTSDGRLFRYTPTGMQFAPVISYQRFDLESIPPEPFSVASPKLDGTTLVDDKAKKYAAILLVPGRIDWQSVAEGQTLGGYLVAAVDRGGAILCTSDRVLVLLVPR